MDWITVDFGKGCGTVKPLHSVNNGPVYKHGADQRQTNLHHFLEAGIPFVRTHDSSICYTYGGEHVVDVAAIFPDFSKNPTDPESYDFTLTDEYLKTIELGGSKVFYRLGSKIEHWKKKYDTIPPKDFRKWAVICEHIIRHYTEGWADGFRMDISYWEIWNEPDLDPDDSVNKRTWGGTAKEFYELYVLTAKHLKACFPHLKIGGPALARVKAEWLEPFLKAIKTADAPLDFLSWHVYGATVEKVMDKIRLARELLDRNGFLKTESILNEWNYVRGWHDEDWIYSIRSIKGLKGSSFIAATMCMSQYEPLDQLMFYDARPCGMNSLFSTDLIHVRLKGYFPFYMFHQLYRQKEAVAVERASKDVWAAAAKGEEKCVLLSYFNEDDSSPCKTVQLNLKNTEHKNGVKIEFYLLDENHDCELCREEIYSSDEISLSLEMPLHSTYLLKIKNL